MAPPAYGDLGKQARDVFDKGYHFGLNKLDIKSKTSSGVEFSNQLNFNQETGKAFGNLETTHRFKDWGLTFTEKVNTDNIFSSTVAVQDKLVKGLKLTLDTSFAPQTGAKTAKLKTAFINDACALNCDMDVDRVKPLINASGVFKYQSWLAGYQMNFDTQKCSVTKNNLALGYSGSDFNLHGSVNNGSVFDTSIYQKVSPKMDYGVSFNWTLGSNDTRCGIGCKYAISEDTNVRTKINNAFQVGLGYQQKLRDGITLTLSALVDGKNFNGGSHKFGLGFEIEA